MADTTLGLTYQELRKNISQYMGFGGNLQAMADHEAEQVETAVLNGMRRFYFNAWLPGAGASHTWSFLQNCLQTITTAASDYLYTLPDDFSKLSNRLVLATENTERKWLTQLNEGQIRQLRAEPNGLTEAVPRVFAIRPLTATPGASTGQRWEVMLHPIPDGVYTISYAYSVQAGRISTATPYPYGGGHHSHTILLACLAEAENMQKEGSAIQEQRYLTALAASISLDRQQISTANLGQNTGGVRQAHYGRDRCAEGTFEYYDFDGGAY
jgi:hypothetical protein